MAEQWPTEHAATVANEAAARAEYERDVIVRSHTLPDGVKFPAWEDADATRKLAYRQAVLPLVWAALQALPDPRPTVWTEGLYCGLRQGYEDDNPYTPSEV